MRFFITGANGMLGQALMAEIEARTGARELDARGVSIEDFDISDGEAVRRAIESYRPDVVIHAAACAVVDDCERNVGMARAVNLNGTHHVARSCERVGASCIYISSDYVFDGAAPPAGGYRESDLPNPLSVYGMTKLAGEAVVSRLDRHLVVRTSWLFGGRDEKTDVVLAAINGIRRGNPAPLITGHSSRPSYAKDVARAIVDVATLPSSMPTGVLHLANQGVADWGEVGKEVVRQMRAAGEETVRVPTLPIEKAGFAGLRPANSSLSTAKSEEIGIPRLPHWRSALARFYGALSEGREEVLDHGTARRVVNLTRREQGS